MFGISEKSCIFVLSSKFTETWIQKIIKSKKAMNKPLNVTEMVRQFIKDQFVGKKICLNTSSCGKYYSFAKTEDEGDFYLIVDAKVTFLFLDEEDDNETVLVNLLLEDSDFIPLLSNDTICIVK